MIVNLMSAFHCRREAERGKLTLKERGLYYVASNFNEEVSHYNTA